MNDGTSSTLSRAADVSEASHEEDAVPGVDALSAPEAPSSSSAAPELASPSSEASKPAEASGSLGDVRLLQIAVYDLEMADNERLGQLLTDQLVVEIRKLAGASVIGMSEIKAMLDHEAAKSMSGCDEDESCLADIAGALGVDVIVIGSIAKVGTEQVVGLRRIDQRNAKVAAQFQQRIVDDGAGEALMATIGPAVETMFADLALKEGEERGVSEAVLYRLDPPPLPAWLFWSAAVGSGAMLVAAASLGLLNGGAWAIHSGYYASGTEAPLQYAQIQQNRLLVDVTAYAAVGALLCGVLGGASTGLIALFTDFVGVEPEEEG